MKYFVITFCVIIILLAGSCTKETPTQPHANIRPRTFLWLFPDSTIAEGTSKEHIRWWGEDPDGIVKGFLFTSGKFILQQGTSPVLDTIGWRWRTTNDSGKTTMNDSIVAFPLLTKRDTFQVVVRAVDNTFIGKLPDQALVRFTPITGATPSHQPFWDKNENGIFDSADILLPNLIGAMDPKGANLSMPVLNQPPSVTFAQNPNNPSILMQQPETTFTAATFSWVGTDPDGDNTIASYEFVLNDTTIHSNYFSVPGGITLVSLVVPRTRTDNLTGVQAVTADVWSGTFTPGLSYSSTRRLLGSIPNLKIDTLNTFFVRARDIAGDASKFIKMPGDSAHYWFVKQPVGKLLIVSDYINSDSASIWKFYNAAFNAVNIPAFANPQVLNIATGLTPTQKSNSQIGGLVPPFIDPAFIYTLQLYDVVYWFTDQLPSLAVAQIPLYQYVRDPSHRGKVIYSTMFQTATDPRGALTDFSPIDSLSSVALSNGRLLPVLGETKIPNGYNLLPDSSDQSDIFPTLTFGNIGASSFGNLTNIPIYSVFMRSIYRRADAKYIYHIQPDNRKLVSYTYVATLNDLVSISSQNMDVWAVGNSGIILHSIDAGTIWQVQYLGQGYTLEAIHVFNATTGIVVGDTGTFYLSSDGGTSWANKSQVTDENFYDGYFFTPENGFLVGTSGILIHTSNGGNDWSSVNLGTGNAIRSITFANDSIGLAVGDNGYITKTVNGGVQWSSKLSLTSARLFKVCFATDSLVFACGSRYTIMRSSNGGESWSQVAGAGTADSIFKSIVFTGASTGYACGTNGTISITADAGMTWTREAHVATQILNGMTFTDPQNGWLAGTNGVILHTVDGGMTWSFQPKGNINVGLVDGVGSDGYRSFLFLGLPLHDLDGSSNPGGDVVSFFQHVLHNEFGF
jgi:photosystem II stability/assembly factor-like uncharacterized protein